MVKKELEDEHDEVHVDDGPRDPEASMHSHAANTHASIYYDEQHPHPVTYLSDFAVWALHVTHVDQLESSSHHDYLEQLCFSKAHSWS